MDSDYLSDIELINELKTRFRNVIILFEKEDLKTGEVSNDYEGKGSWSGLYGLLKYAEIKFSSIQSAQNSKAVFEDDIQ